MSDYGLHESRGYFGRIEGKVRIELFDCEIPFMAMKDCDEIYARRCAEYIEKITCEDETLHRVFEVAADYLTDFFNEHSGEFDIDESVYESITAEDIPKLCVPFDLLFERHDLLSDEESPVAFTMKLRLRELPDEEFQIAMREDTPVYVGECRNISLWNDNLLKKKWNYLNR